MIADATDRKRNVVTPSCLVTTNASAPDLTFPRLKRPILLVGNFLSSTHKVLDVCEELAGQLVASGWPVFTTSSKPERLPRMLDMINTAWSKRHQYAAAQVDVYSGAAFLWAEAVCWMLRRAGKPYILTLHGGGLPDFARSWPRRVRYLLRYAVVVTTPSLFLLEKMAPYRSDLVLLPNALDLSAYAFRARQRPQLHLIWLRAFSAIYNPSLAPRVLARLKQDFPDVRLTMIGPDKEDGSLQEMQQVATELGVMDLISLPGGVPKGEVPDWMNKGDIFLNTTNIDNAPVSVLEAMACGLNVVSTNVGGIPYLLRHQQDALLVPPNDSQAMAAAVRRIYTEPGLSERLSVNGRATANQFDWSAILPQWEALLSAVADGH